MKARCFTGTKLKQNKINIMFLQPSTLYLHTHTGTHTYTYIYMNGIRLRSKWTSSSSPHTCCRWLGRFIVFDSFWVMYTGYRLTYKFNIEGDGAAEQEATHLFSQQKHALYIVFWISYLLRLVLTAVFAIRSSSNRWVSFFFLACAYMDRL